MKKMKAVCLTLISTMCLGMLAGCGSKAKDPAEAMKQKYSQYVTLGDYSGLEYTPNHTEVTDEDIQREIDSLISQGTEKKEVTSGVATMGDAVNIDYVGSIDGVEFEGGSTQGNGTVITLGQSGYIDDFDEQIAGHEVGDTFNVEVTFPENYGKEDLNGRDAVFVTTLNSIQVDVAPKYDDELVASLTEFQTTADFEAAKRAEMTADNKKKDEQQDRSDLLKIVVDTSAISQYPEKEVKEMVDMSMDQIRQSAESNNIDVNTYIMYVYGAMDEESFKAEIEKSATDYIQEKMVVASIAQAEGISVSKDEVDAKIQEILDSYGLKDKSALDGYYTEDDFYYYALADKVVDFIMEHAVITTDAQ